MTPPRTQADVADAALRVALAPWLSESARLISGKADDALAHARNALTDTLKRAADGRSTRAKAAASPSYRAALGRLDELADALLDLARLARREFYGTAFAVAKPEVPVSLWVSADPKPTVRNLDRFAALLIHGETLTGQITASIDRSKRSLLPALTLAGRAAESGKTAHDRLKTWRDQVERTTSSAVRLMLSDSQIAARTQSLRDLIRPDAITQPSP